MSIASRNSTNSSDFGQSWRYSNDKIFGRELETRQIDDILFDLSGGATEDSKDEDDDFSTSSSALLEIRGMAGSGKSSLITHYPFKQKGWLLCTGKFDINKTAEPYSAVIEALDQLIEQWILDEEKRQEIQELNMIIEAAEEEEDSDDDEGDSEKKATTNLDKFRELLKKELHMDILKNVMPRVLVIGGILTPRESIVQPGARKSLSFCREGGREGYICPDASKALFHDILSFLSTTRRVVLFLDDIQWADEASLSILESWVKSKDLIYPNQGKREGGLLVAVSYREEEVDESHKVTAWLHDIKDSGILTRTIQVKDLQVESLNALVAHLVGHEPAETLPLTAVIHQKTAGNPFFVLQLLTLLRYEEFLKYNFVKFKWEWGQIHEIQFLANISDNVADVVAATIQRLPQETQVILQVASCLGRKVVPVDVLNAYFAFLMSLPRVNDDYGISSSTLENITRDGGMAAIQTAVTHGILVECNGVHSTPADTSVNPNKSNKRWAHDKLMQFSYDLIPANLRSAWHLRLGKILWTMSKAKMGQEWMVFSAADQMNRSHDLTEGCDINDSENSCNYIEVARLNLEAAKLSINKAALFPAMDMLRSASLYLLEHYGGQDNGSWEEENYDLSLEIFSRLAEIGVKIGQHEDVMNAVKQVEAKAKSIDDKYRAHRAMLTMMTSGNNRDYDLGVRNGLEILRLYGENLPKRFFRCQAFLEKRKLKRNLPGGNLEELLKLPELVDGRAVKVTNLLLQHVGHYALFLDKQYRGLRSLCTLRSLNIACKYGLTESSATLIFFYAIDLKMTGHYQEALRYAKLAIGLADRFPQRVGSYQCQLRTQAVGAIFGAVTPQGTNLEGLLDAHKIGLKVGDTEHAILALMVYCWSYISVGLPIRPWQRDLVRYFQEAETLKVAYSVQVQFKIWQQTVLNLQRIEPYVGEQAQHDDDTEQRINPCTVLVGDVMNQEDELKKLDGGGVQMTLRDINTARLMLACIYSDLDTVREMIDALEEYLKSDIFVARSYFRILYLGLGAFALSRKNECKKNKKRYRKLGEKALQFFQKEASLGSVNAVPVLRMLQAEKFPSKEGYEEAIRTCARLGLSHHEAYMCERAGEYFLNIRHDEEWGKTYFDRALALYKDWGATGKAHAIMTGPYMHILTPAKNTRVSHNTALKGRRRFTKGHSKLLKSIQGTVSFRGSSLFSTGSNYSGTM